MVGFDLDDEEILAAGGLACLVLRIVWGVGTVVWMYLRDTTFATPMGSSRVKWVFLVCLVMQSLMTACAVGALTTALISVLGGPPAVVRELVYGIGIGIGVAFGILLEMFIFLRLHNFSMWLAAHRVPRYREQLQSSNAEERLKAAGCLEHLAAYARPARLELLAGMRDDSADVRAACARAVLNSHDAASAAEDRDALPTARKALADSDPRVRAAAAAILAQFRAATSGELLPPLIEAISSSEAATVIVALTGLKALGPDAAPACPAMVEAITQNAEESSRRIAQPAFFEAFQAIGAEAVPALIELVERGEMISAMTAMSALGKIGEPARAALPGLRKVIATRAILKFTAQAAVRKIERAIRRKERDAQV